MIRLATLAVPLSLAGPALAAEPASCAPDRVVFERPDGSRTSITVEVVDTEATRAKGLMFRQHMAPNRGMLFIYEAPQPVAFWMKNTPIPLDMLFLDQTGRLAHIHSGAKPHDETPIPGNEAGDPDPDRLMVVEVAAGEAARLRLSEGALMAHPRLPQATAALPCSPPPSA